MATECPSGIYLAELVTASGLTIEHPLEDPGSTGGVPHSLFDWSGSEHDYEEWHALTAARMGDLEHAWRLVKDWPKTASMPVAEYNGFVDRLNACRQDWANLRIPWRGESSAANNDWGWGGPDWMLDTTGEIAKTVQLVKRVQCLRQNLDDRLADMGGIPVRPGQGHAAKDDGLGIVGTALLVAGAITIVGGAVAFARKLAKGRSASA